MAITRSSAIEVECPYKPGDRRVMINIPEEENSFAAVEGTTILCGDCTAPNLASFMEVALDIHLEPQAMLMTVLARGSKKDIAREMITCEPPEEVVKVIRMNQRR